MAHTEQALRELLNRIATEHNYSNYEMSINEIESGGANYTSKLFTVVITEPNKDDLHLFAKVAVIGEQLRVEFPPIFDVERYFYTTLSKTYQSLEDEYELLDEHRLSYTKFYGCNPSLYQETLVLENLMAHGYVPHNRFKSIDWEYASCAIQELAKLHALSFKYCEKFPEEFEKDLRVLKVEFKERLFHEFTKGSVKTAMKSVKPQYKKALERFFEKYNMKQIYLLISVNIIRPVIVHGDFRGSNLMHRVREVSKYYINGPVKSFCDERQIISYLRRNMAHTELTLRKLLNKIATEHNYSNYEMSINEIESGGANYTSKLYTIDVREPNKADLHLFAKVATMGENFRSKVPLIVFDTERFVYTKLWKIYESLEEENKVPEENRLLFTKFYGSDPTLYQETVVLENLLAQGFGPFDRFKPLDWEYASSAIRELAKMHALSFAYSKKYPQEFENVLADLNMEWKEEVMDTMTHGTKGIALKAVKPEYREALDKFMERYMKDLLTRFGAAIRRPVIVHGDYRGSNLMHRVREDGKVDIKIVDLQTLQGGSPVTDLLYFIFTGSDEQFRALYYDRLIDHYYTQLSAAMKRLHLDPEEVYSRENFDAELQEKLPYGLTLAVFTLPVITVEAENAPQVNADLEIADFSVEKTSDLYVERLNGVVNDFVKWGILK